MRPIHRVAERRARHGNRRGWVVSDADHRAAVTTQARGWTSATAKAPMSGMRMVMPLHDVSTDMGRKTWKAYTRPFHEYIDKNAVASP